MPKAVVAQLSKIHPHFDFSKVKFVDVYHSIDVICQIHGVFKADTLEALKGKLVCPHCCGLEEAKTPEKYLHSVNKKFKEPKVLSTSDIATVRESFISIQDNLCPLCNRELDRPVLDHWHKSRNYGNGNVRLVLCSSCNSLLGKIENALPRYKVPFSLAPKWLNNVVGYITMGTSKLLHPTEKPIIKLSKTEFSKLKALVLQDSLEFKFSYPKNGIIKNTKLLNIYLQYKDKL